MNALKRLGTVVVVGLGVLVTVGSGDSDSGKTGDTKTSDTQPSDTQPSDTKTPDSKAPSGAFADVTITACALPDNEFLGPEAKLTVKNNSSKTSSYFISISFDSADGTQQLDTGIASVSNLGPGQSAEETASSLKSETREKAGAFKCKVTDVTRFAS